MEKPTIIQQQSQSNGRAGRWYKPYATKSKPTRSKSRSTQESLSKSVVLWSHGDHDTQHGNTLDSTRQDLTSTSYDTCLTKTQSYSGGWVQPVNKLESAWLGRDSRTDEHFDRNTEWHGSKPSIETPSGMTTLGHHSLERHGLGSLGTDTSHGRKSTESSQPP